MRYRRMTTAAKAGSPRWGGKLHTFPGLHGCTEPSRVPRHHDTVVRCYDCHIHHAVADQGAGITGRMSVPCSRGAAPSCSEMMGRILGKEHGPCVIQELAGRCCWRLVGTWLGSVWCVSTHDHVGRCSGHDSWCSEATKQRQAESHVPESGSV